MGKIEQILEAIRSSETFLILTHVRPDGDAICSALAMRELIVAFGKNADKIDVFIPHVSKDLAFIDVNNVITSNCSRVIYDLTIVVDCADIQRVEGSEILNGDSSKQCVLIDHHEPSGVSLKPSYSLVDTTAPSCTCIVHREFSAYIDSQRRASFDRLVAIGILSDTVDLTLNVTVECHRILESCQKSGVETTRISQQLKNIEPRTHALAALAIERLSYRREVGCTYILQSDLLPDERSLNMLNHKGIIKQILEIASCDSLVLLIENNKQQFKGSMRTSAPDVDLSAICAAMVESNCFVQGGGHTNSAGFTMAISDTETATLESVFEFLTLAIVGD